MRLLLLLFLAVGTAALAEDFILGFDPGDSQALEAEFEHHLLDLPLSQRVIL